MNNNQITKTQWLLLYKKSILCEYRVLNKMEEISKTGLKELGIGLYEMLESEAISTSKLPKRLEQLLLEGNVI